MDEIGPNRPNDRESWFARLRRNVFTGRPFSGLYWLGTSLVSGLLVVAAIGRREWLIAAGAAILTVYGMGNGIVAARSGRW